MIDLYASTTPNVFKIIIMLEETKLDYRLKPLNVWKGEQFTDEFIRLNPNSKIPVIVDHDHRDGPYAVFESGAILFYLAEKAGAFLPAEGRPRHDVMQWLVFQVANLGPISGQFTHFERYAGPGNDYAFSRYTTELRRLYGVMERRLGQVPFLGGENYSIADIAVLPWVFIQSNRLRETFPFLDKQSPSQPNIAAWIARCEARPGVQRALEVPATLKSGLPNATPEELDRAFGRGRYAYGRETVR
jgi:GST-like protein